MAQGTVEWFDEALYQMALGTFNLETDVIKLALVDSTTTPLTTTAVPHWGGTGTTDFSTWQVATAGSYTGPVTLANNTVALSAGVINIDWHDPAAWAANASNDTDTRWGIIYDDTDTSKRCLGWVDLGSSFDHTTGTLTIVFGTPAATLNQA